MNILILNGTYNPVDNGHLRAVKALFNALKPDKIIFILTKSSGCDYVLDFNHRQEMLKVALDEINLECEIEFYKGHHIENDYPFMTIKNLKSKYLNDNLIYAIGSDKLDVIAKLHEAENITQYANIRYYKVSGAYNLDVAKELNIPEIKEADISSYPFISSIETREFKHIENIPMKVIDYIFDNGLYFAKQINSLYLLNERKERLLNHARSVARLAYGIALRHNLNGSIKYFIAGLLHDIGKCYTNESLKRLIRENYAEYLDLPVYAYHQFASHYIAKEIFYIDDEEILDAIKFHCTGKADMNPVLRVVYASDKIDPARGYDSQYMIDAMNANPEDGFKFVLKENIIFLNSKTNNNGVDNRLTKECVDYYLSDINLEELKVND